MAQSIPTQPVANGFYAAYRPIYFNFLISGLTTKVVYCDIYFSGVYYRTVSSTQAKETGVDSQLFEFDIQDACQEFLKTFLATNGSPLIQSAEQLFKSTFVRFRWAYLDADGFLASDQTAPIQGTGNTDPVDGGGLESHTFFVVNSTLRHTDNQDILSHLKTFRSRLWDVDAYPLTHRPKNQTVKFESSDYFPILLKGDDEPSCLRLNYRLKNQSTFTQITNCQTEPPEPVCVPVFIVSLDVPDGIQEEDYSGSIVLGGNTPYTIDSESIPAWMTANLVGNTISLSGTPPIPSDEDQLVQFTISNECGSVEVNEAIVIVPSGDDLPLRVTLVRTSTDLNGFISGGVPPYNYVFEITGSGSACAGYTIDNPTGTAASAGGITTNYSAFPYSGATYTYSLQVTDSASTFASSPVLSWPACLVPLTKIMMKDGGEKYLKDIVAGDVLFGSNKVLKAEAFMVGRLLIINEGLLMTSESHINVMSDGKTKESSFLKEGDELMDKDGHPVTIKKLSWLTAGSFHVINIATQTKTYIANGILTHNKLAC